MGTATITLSMTGWPGVAVAPTTDRVPVVRPPAVAVKPEPVAANLLATLPCSDRRAEVWTVTFSADGRRLAFGGSESGIVQVFDAATHHEVRRFSVPGFRGGDAVLSRDGRTVYVPVLQKEFLPVEVAGKRTTRISYGGTVRVWDVETGKERPALASPPGSGPYAAALRPDGRALMVQEFRTYDAGQRQTNPVAEVDLLTGRRRTVTDRGAVPHLSADGTVVASIDFGPAEKDRAVRLVAAATGRELCRIPHPADGRPTHFAGLALDGSVFALRVLGDGGKPSEVWFRDVKTGADRGRLVAPAGRQWGVGAFLSGGRYAVPDGSGTLTVWDVAAGKVGRTVPGAGQGFGVVSAPDGTTVAVAWSPPPPPGLGDDPDPADLPQPRVTLVDLAGDKPPRTLVAPPGVLGGVAFRPDGKLLALGSSGGVHLFDLTR